MKKTKKAEGERFISINTGIFLFITNQAVTENIVKSKKGLDILPGQTALLNEEHCTIFINQSMVFIVSSPTSWSVNRSFLKLDLETNYTMVITMVSFLPASTQVSITMPRVAAIYRN